MQLVGVGITFVRVPFAALAFGSLVGNFSEIDELEFFAELLVACGTVGVGLVRCVPTGSQ